MSARPVEAARDLRPLGEADFEALGAGPAPSRQQLSHWCRFGLLAPTSHNTVPQRFRVADGGGLDVFLDRAAVLPASDPTGRQAVLSAGCAVGHVALAARCWGYGAGLAVDPVSAEELRPAPERRLVRLARLSFSRRGAAADPALLQSMLERRMVRAEYDRSPLTRDLAARLAASVAERPGLDLRLLTDAPTLLFLGKFQEVADTTVLNRETFAHELGAWLLPNDSTSPLGMRGREFGLSDEVALRIHRGLLGLAPLQPSEAASFAKAGGVWMRSASAVAVITADRDDMPHWLAAGQAFSDLALLLHREGYCLAMHAGVVEVESASLALRSRLRTARRPLALFRIGRPLRPEDARRPLSSRPSLDAIWMHDERRPSRREP